MFKGFDIPAPELDVVLPQTQKSFRVRSLRMSEEGSAKSSLLGNAQSIIKKLNHLVYNAIVDNDKPEPEQFLQQVTTKDRDALVFGMYQITYGDEYTFEDYTCANCQKTYSLRAFMSKGFVRSDYKVEDGQSILDKRITLELETGLQVVLKQITLEDEVNILAATSADDPLTELYSKIDKFIYTSGEGQKLELNIKDTPMDFLYGCGQLLPKHKKLINDAHTKEFNQYGVKVNINYVCPHCGHKENFNLDFVKQFFLLVCGLI